MTEKRKFASPILYGDGWTEEGLGALARKNPEVFMTRAQEMIDKGELAFSNVSSLRHLFDSLFYTEVKHQIADMFGNKRTITSSAFPLLVGGLVIKEVNNGMESVASIGNQLVTESDDAKKWTHYAGILVTAPHQAGLAEMEQFPEIAASSERFDIGNRLNGYMMSITGQAIEENEIPQIVSKCNKLGQIVDETVEELTLDRVTDHFGSATSAGEPYVLRINGTGTSLYQTSNSTLTRLSTSGNRITNNALTDETDLENARARLASFTNERGKRVNLPPSRCLILVPDALVGTARKIRGSEMTPGVENELNNWGPRGAYQSAVLSSSKVDDISTSAWYYGDFKAQFIRKWKLRFENATLGGTSTEAWLKQRIAAQYRMAYDCEVGAIGYQSVVQCLSGTTAP